MISTRFMDFERTFMAAKMLAERIKAPVIIMEYPKTKQFRIFTQATWSELAKQEVIQDADILPRMLIRANGDTERLDQAVSSDPDQVLHTTEQGVYKNVSLEHESLVDSTKNM